MKRFVLFVALAIFTAMAQTGGPTKVTGKSKSAGTGVEYWDIVAGAGDAAVKGKSVTVNYTGWLTNGRQFDTSVGKQPFTFKLGAGQVIPGWDEGVAGMKVGGKRQLKIAPAQAYGANGYPPVIPPNSTLIFDVELLGVR